MLKTEMRNQASTHIDRMQTADMVALMAKENYNAVRAVEEAAPAITQAVDVITNAFENGHRLFFIGAGTSGRLGVLDAAECPPTFGVSPEMVTGIIAGGHDCMFRASENQEDNEASGRADVIANGLSAGDVLVGISVAGGAAYVVGTLRKAKELGAIAIALTSNENTPIEKEADVTIVTDTGAEIVTGSTRLKAGTAHKMVLNILTTCAMIKTGKVYENMMINLRPSNVKLRARTIRIVQEILGCDEASAIEKLEANEWNIRRAVSEEE